MKWSKAKPIRKVVVIKDFNKQKNLGRIRPTNKYKIGIFNKIFNYIQKY